MAAAMGIYACRGRGARDNNRAAVILVLGDSVEAPSTGIYRAARSWVALLEKQLAADKISASVVNASVSGETASGGRSRIAALLQQHQPTHVVIELGGNDALRGLPLQNYRTT